MDGLQVSIACLLLKMTFDPSTAQPLSKPIGCPTCPEGYFVVKNCSVNIRGGQGVQCEQCTNCSAARQDTLVTCSTFADSVCGNRSTSVVTATPSGRPVSAPDVWIILTLIVFSLFLVLLLGLFLTLLLCRNHQRNECKGLDPL